MLEPKHLPIALLLALPLHASEGDVELADNMSQLQYFTHKATLAVEARNQPLAAFYLHELEEVTEETRAIAHYEGYPVGKLTTSMLTPALAGLDASLDKADWPAVSAAVDGGHGDASEVR